MVPHTPEVDADLARQGGRPWHGPPLLLGRQQSAAADQAAQSTARRSGARAPILRTSMALGNARALSTVAAHSVTSPSSRPRRTSVGIPRTVRVTGATKTVLSTSMAWSRVTTRYGRPFASGDSPHQISPCRGLLTTALGGWTRSRLPSRARPRRRSAGDAGTRRRSRLPRVADVPRPPVLRWPSAPPRPCWRSHRGRRPHPAPARAHPGCELQSALTCNETTVLTLLASAVPRGAEASPSWIDVGDGRAARLLADGAVPRSRDLAELLHWESQSTTSVASRRRCCCSSASRGRGPGIAHGPTCVWVRSPTSPTPVTAPLPSPGASATRCHPTSSPPPPSQRGSPGLRGQGPQRCCARGGTGRSHRRRWRSWRSRAATNSRSRAT